MISKISDGFTDLVIGYIVDRTKTKWGKARPYELAITFLWLFIYMMYATPEMGKVATYAWVFVTYFLQNSICITILYGSEGVYMVRSIKYPENRTKVTAAAGIWQMVICTVVGMIVPQMAEQIGVDRHGWAMLALCMAIPCGTIGLLRFFLIPELDVNEESAAKTEVVSLKGAIRSLRGNKFIWIFAVMYFAYHFSNGFSGAAQTYYLKYIVGDLGVGTWLNAGSLLSLPLLFIAPKLMEKLGTGKTLRIGIFIMALGPVIRWAGGANTATLIVGTLLFVAGSVPIAFMLNIYLFECMDYGEWKTGTRVEGMMGSITSFMAKIASAFSTGAFGIMLSLAHYEGMAEVQSAGTITGISLLYNLVPLIICVASLLVSTRYTLGRQLPQIRQELEQRHQTISGK